MFKIVFYEQKKTLESIYFTFAEYLVYFSFQFNKLKLKNLGMLLRIRLDKIDGENVVLQGNFAAFSVSNGYTTLFNIFDNIHSETTFSCFGLLLF